MSEYYGRWQFLYTLAHLLSYIVSSRRVLTMWFYESTIMTTTQKLNAPAIDSVITFLPTMPTKKKEEKRDDLLNRAKENFISIKFPYFTFICLRKKKIFLWFFILRPRQEHYRLFRNPCWFKLLTQSKYKLLINELFMKTSFHCCTAR